MSLDNFDFGAELAEASGVKRVNPEVGLHFARLRSVIHLGSIAAMYRGKPKPPVNKAAFIFELKGDLDEIDDLHPDNGEPLCIGIGVNLTKGDNAKLTEVMAALISKKEMEEGTVKGMDDLIGRVCQLDLKGSDAKGDDGKPKYVDIKSLSPVAKAFAAQIPELSVAGVGHCRLSQLTMAAMDELNVFLDVQEGIMKSEEWKAGTHPAIALVEEIRKERPNYAKAEKKVDKGADEPQGEQEPSKPVEQMNTDEEF